MTRKRTAPTSEVGARSRALKEGYRSGLEAQVAEQLAQAGIQADYEGYTLRYTKPAKESRYTPDFRLPNGIIIETKGRFVTADRQKHLHVKAAHPGLDIRFVFSRSAQTIGKKSKTTYADWCRQKGFQYADRLIPEAWLKEPVRKDRIEAAAKAFGERP